MALASPTKCNYNLPMQFEWDEKKRLFNLEKHAIDFQDAMTAFETPFLTLEDKRFDYGEKRFITLGLMQGRVIVVVHTEREETIRLISARKANKYEQDEYHKRTSH